jgi:ABC-type multidrug transport system ATPase subunit
MDATSKPRSLGSIQIVAGPLSGRTFPITKPSLIIGRDAGSDIVITDPTVSRQHARLQRDTQGNWSIEKLNANNVVTVNQQGVQQARVKDRDSIGLGANTFFVLQLNVQEQKPPVSLSAETRAAPQQAAIAETRAAPPPLPVENRTVAARSYDPGALKAAPLVPASPPAPKLVASPPAQPPVGVRGTQIAPPLGQDAEDGTPSLEIGTNTNQITHVYKLTRPVINIGRDPSNDIVINDPIVSSFHVQIVRDEEQLILMHPHPSRTQTVNGLLYQGQKIAGDEKFRRTLSRGDVFRIGDVDGTLVTLKYNDGTGNPQETPPEIRPIPLDAQTITIGRLPGNTVVLNHPQVSAQHARLERVKNTYRIYDLGSTNHVYVNSQQVRERLLSPGDEIRIGPFKLTFTGTQLTQQDESSSIRIDALNLKKTGSRKVVLLNDITIVIPPRKFVALVGGSGAGKSTLMDALNGLRPAKQGVVLYNGQDYYQNLAAFSTQLGYVPQDDIIHRDLSVERALYYAAKMRLPDDFTETQIKQRIDEVLEDVEMKHRRKLLVSKLSGGQRKRVSIALELLAKPAVFFLDEPTSGLDPGLDRKMMLLLRRLADRGHTIVLVTHATNNINVCDYVCFLAQGGRVAYYGPPNDAKAYFGKASFAEIYTSLEPTEENPNIPAEAEARFKASADYQRYVIEPLNQGPAGRGRIDSLQETTEIKLPRRGKPLKQFLLLSLRYTELLKNDVGNLLILLLQAPVIAIILMFLSGPDTFAATRIANCPTRDNILDTTGPIVSNDCQRVLDFLNTAQGQAFVSQQGKSKLEVLQDFIAPGSGAVAQQILFIMAFAAVMFGCINAAREIVKEGPIYRRERTVNLGIAPYMFSKIVVLGTLCLLQSAVLVLIVNLRIPLRADGIFLPALLEAYITLALTSLAGLMIGLAVSAIAPNNDRAMSFVPIILIPQVIFSGIVFTLEDKITQTFAGLFAARWAIAGLGSTVGLHGDKLGVDDFAFCGTLFSTCSKSDAIVHLFIVWGALVVMIILLGLGVAFFLKRKDVRV